MSNGFNLSSSNGVDHGGQTTPQRFIDNLLQLRDRWFFLKYMFIIICPWGLLIKDFAKTYFANFPDKFILSIINYFSRTFKYCADNIFIVSSQETVVL